MRGPFSLYTIYKDESAWLLKKVEEIDAVNCAL